MKGKHPAKTKSSRTRGGHEKRPQTGDRGSPARGGAQCPWTAQVSWEEERPADPKAQTALRLTARGLGIPQTSAVHQGLGKSVHRGGPSFRCAQGHVPSVKIKSIPEAPSQILGQSTLKVTSNQETSGA